MFNIDPKSERGTLDHQKVDLSYERGFQNAGEILVCIDELERCIRMMKGTENETDFAQGFMSFMNKREHAFLKRIAELRESLEDFK